MPDLGCLCVAGSGDKPYPKPYPEIRNSYRTERFSEDLTEPNVYVGMIALAIVAPRVAVFGYLVVAIVALLRTRGDTAAAGTATRT
jgi:hypothetical protein